MIWRIADQGIKHALVEGAGTGPDGVLFVPYQVVLVSVNSYHFSRLEVRNIRSMFVDWRSRVNLWGFRCIASPEDEASEAGTHHFGIIVFENLDTKITFP